MAARLETRRPGSLSKSCHTRQIETTGVFRQVPPWVPRWQKYPPIRCGAAIGIFPAGVTFVTPVTGLISHGDEEV